ncbi:MAG: peptidylprolyl isomerase [Alcanivorax sp.]|nr:peptidylprolyl isomerase [Alcanivorax sp.]
MQKRYGLMLAVLVVAAAAVAAWHWRPLPASVAARIDGEDIPLAALDVFVRASRLRDPQATRESVLKGLVENRLLARVQASQPVVTSPQRVGYDAATQLEHQRFKLLRSAFAAPLQKAVTASGTRNSLGYLTRPLALDGKALAPLLSVQQQLYSDLTAGQQAAAANYVLARYRFSPQQPEQQLTLWGLYRRQNVQLKVQMQNLNLGFIREAVRQYLTEAYVFYWFEHHSGLSAKARAAVNRCVADAMARETLLRHLGLHHDMHEDNPQLRQLAARVSDQEVAAYYHQHQDDFIHIQRVHARHIRLDSQAEADQVYQKIQQGLTFDQAVRQFSRAADRSQGGALGWIDRDSKLGHWSLALAFVQPLNQVSRPFRSPDTDGPAHWEILLVDQRDTRFQRIDSEAVHYRASRAIARDKLLQQFRDLVAQTSAAARVQIHHEVL